MSTSMRRARTGLYVPQFQFPGIPTAGAGRIISSAQANTTAVRTFPALSGLTKNSGDLLIALVTSYGTNTTNNFSAWDQGFTEFADLGGSSQMITGCAWKISDGTETAAPTVHEDNTVSGQAEMIILSISGARAQVPEVSGYVLGTTSAADPPSLSPSWGLTSTLWINVVGNGCASATGTFTGVTAPPTNYSNQYAVGPSAGTPTLGVVDFAVAFRQNAATSENVSTATVDLSNARNMAFTIAVRPA